MIPKIKLTSIQCQCDPFISYCTDVVVRGRGNLKNYSKMNSVCVCALLPLIISSEFISDLAPILIKWLFTIVHTERER